MTHLETAKLKPNAHVSDQEEGEDFMFNWNKFVVSFDCDTDKDSPTQPAAKRAAMTRSSETESFSWIPETTKQNVCFLNNFGLISRRRIWNTIYP